MLLLYMKAYSFHVMLFITTILLMANGLNTAANFPFRIQDISSLPKAVQDDLISYMMNWYKKIKQAPPSKANRRATLGIHFHVHDCETHGDPEPSTIWDLEYNLCGKQDLIDWCREDSFMYLYKTTDHVLALDDGFHLHMSLSCFRVQLFSRYLIAFLRMVPSKITWLGMIIILAYMKHKNFGDDAMKRLIEIQEERRIKAEQAAQHAPPPPTIEQGHPKVKKNLMSRHGNYKKRR